MKPRLMTYKQTEGLDSFPKNEQLKVYCKTWCRLLCSDVGFIWRTISFVLLIIAFGCVIKMLHVGLDNPWFLPLKAGCCLIGVFLTFISTQRYYNRKVGQRLAESAAASEEAEGVGGQ